MTIDKKYYRAKEACVYLGISRSGLWLYAKQGKLTAIKITSRVTVFAKNDLDRFVESATK
jgi:excisionase family DNA binding protein